MMFPTTDPTFLLAAANALVLPFVVYFGFRRAFTRGMRQRSGEELDKKYKKLLAKRGKLKRRKSPKLRFVGRWSRVRWRYPFLRREAKYWIWGPHSVGRAHFLATIAHVWTTINFIHFSNVEHNEPRFPIHEQWAAIYLTSAAVFLMILLCFTRVVPALGRWFRAKSFALRWVARLAQVWVLFSGYQFFVASCFNCATDAIAPLLVYVLVWWLFLLPERLFMGGSRRSLAKNLLVLRVFGSARRSIFLFNRLQPLWNSLGAVFTISSPDQVTSVFSGWRPKRSRVLVVIVLAGTLFYAEHQALAMTPSLLGFAKTDEIMLAASAVGLALAGLAFLAVPFQWMVQSSFLSDEDAVYRQIMSSVEGPERSGFYSNTYYSSHDDNWQSTIEGIAGIADVVLIDLRGFTNENRGTAFELAFVVNNFPLENVVALADKSTELDAVEAVLKDASQHMVASSPNAEAGQQDFMVYRRRRLRGKDVFKVASFLVNNSLRNEKLGLTEEQLRAI